MDQTTPEPDAGKPPGGQPPAGKPLRITMRDIRAAGMCSSGARSWFDRYGLDWCKFVKCGLPETAILATRDALGEVVVEKAHQREAIKAAKVQQLPAGDRGGPPQ